MRTVKAVGLLSGGLDSTLATALLLEQGVEIQGLNFSTGFCLTDHRRAMRRETDPRRIRNEALRCGADLRVPVDIVDICNSEYLGILTKPKYGYGSAANPCVDCRSFMFRRAREYMESEGGDFVYTGEVLGQRPMSQHMKQLRIIERESGLAGLLLRPLSARLLDPTIPEVEGWVDRTLLGRISGRSRKGQIELAERFGLGDFPQPAGGCCYLTDKSFAARFRDFLKFQPGEYVPRYDDFLLLKVGRHFRLPTGTKVIVGRDAAENRFLIRFYDGHWVFQVRGFEGPTVLSPEPLEEDDAGLVAGIAGRYSAGRAEALLEVAFGRAGHLDRLARVSPLAEAMVKTWQL
jgi:tRNA U34 2-thiouridine synthase MnmA/TrmU